MAVCRATNYNKSKCQHEATLFGLCMKHFIRDEYKNIIKNKSVQL